MTKQIGEVDVSVTNIELTEGVSAGIRWRRLDPEFVPLFEEHHTREELRISVDDWYRLDPMERALKIAIKRIETAMKNIQAEAEIKKAKADAEKARKK